MSNGAHRNPTDCGTIRSKLLGRYGLGVVDMNDSNVSVMLLVQCVVHVRLLLTVTMEVCCVMEPTKILVVVGRSGVHYWADMESV